MVGQSSANADGRTARCERTQLHKLHCSTVIPGFPVKSGTTWRWVFQTQWTNSSNCSTVPCIKILISFLFLAIGEWQLRSSISWFFVKHAHDDISAKRSSSAASSWTILGWCSLIVDITSLISRRVLLLSLTGNIYNRTIIVFRQINTKYILWRIFTCSVFKIDEINENCLRKSVAHWQLHKYSCSTNQQFYCAQNTQRLFAHLSLILAKRRNLGRNRPQVIQWNAQLQCCNLSATIRDSNFFNETDTVVSAACFPDVTGCIFAVYA